MRSRRKVSKGDDVLPVYAIETFFIVWPAKAVIGKERCPVQDHVRLPVLAVRSPIYFDPSTCERNRHALPRNIGPAMPAGELAGVVETARPTVTSWNAATPSHDSRPHKGSSAGDQS